MEIMACAVALIDRLTHHAEIVAIDGESYRKREAEQAQKRKQASIRTTKDRQLMAQGKTLKEEVSTHRQGDPNRHDRGKGGAQGL